MLETISVNDIKDLVDEHTLGFSISAPWIFKNDIINLFNGNLFNIHNSALPFFRGGGGYSWPILCSNRIGGVAIHDLTVGIDTGKIIMSRDFIYPVFCRIPLGY